MGEKVMDRLENISGLGDHCVRRWVLVGKVETFFANVVLLRRFSFVFLFLTFLHFLSLSSLII